MRYEILDVAGKVVNTIAADLAFVAAAYPGRYREVPDATPPNAPPVEQRLSVLAFRSRITTAEKQRVYTAAKTNVEVQIWLDDLIAASPKGILLNDPRTIAGVEGMEVAGLLDHPGRAKEILEAPMLPDEAF